MTRVIPTRFKHYLPFSKCQLWQKQKNFYQKEGIGAWQHKIPFYATSNSYIAHSYAQLIIAFIQDILDQHTGDINEPFYIIELGAGSGAFSYYVLKELLEIQKNLNLEHIKIIYVMTDFVKKNIYFWQKHPCLRQYINKGCLDFAFYDCEKTQDIKLLLSGRHIQRNDLKNPVILLANYIFDSLKHDVFHVRNNELEIGVIKRSPDISAVKDNASAFLESIDPGFHYRSIALPYYNDKYIDGVLDHYRHINEESYFIFPIGVLACLNKWRQISGNNMLLLVTDKGHGRSRLYNYKPELVVHDKAFSMMVNFHAISQYFQSQEGDSYCQHTEQAITSAAFTFGYKINNLPKTRQATINYLDNFSAGNLFSIYKHIEQVRNSCTLDTIIACLNCTRWDNRIFDLCLPVILREIEQANNPLAIHNLVTVIEHIAANFYYLPRAGNTLFNIGVLFFKLSNYPLALNYYKRSITYFGKSDVVLYNMALCHINLKEHELALNLFKEVLSYNSEHIMAKGWLSYLITKNRVEL